MAMTNRMWINPPIVVLLTTPSSQRTMRMTEIVHNIRVSFLSLDLVQLFVFPMPCGIQTGVGVQFSLIVERN